MVEYCFKSNNPDELWKHIESIRIQFETGPKGYIGLITKDDLYKDIRDLLEKKYKFKLCYVGVTTPE
jgi:hypothetical protein